MDGCVVQRLGLAASWSPCEASLWWTLTTQCLNHAGERDRKCFDFFTLLRVEDEESGSVFDRSIEGIIEARKDLLDVMTGRAIRSS